MPWKEILLALVIFVLSFFSVISGGIGLLSRPILIMFGLPPSVAIGTFRVSNLIARIGGALSFIQQRKSLEIDWKLAFHLFIPSFLGGIIGAEIVSFVNPHLLKMILGIFIVAIGLVLLVRKDLGIVSHHTKMSRAKQAVGIISTLVIGIIAAFVGGSGILFAYLLILNYDKSYLSSAPVRKLANFGSALSSSLLFVWYDIVDWKLMVIILIAGGLGEYFGGRYQIQKGEVWIRRVTLAMIFAGGAAMFFL